MSHIAHELRVVPAFAALLACAMLLSIGVVSQASTLGDAEPALVDGAPIDMATLVKTTQMWQFSPPSPDPAGIVYLPSSRSLLIADSEVNEMEHLFTGDNLFNVTPGGDLLRTTSTVHFSDEPTGVAVNPENGFLYFGDDSGARGFYEVNLGSDSLYGTLDDVIRFINTELFGARDVEGIAFDSRQGHIFLAHGADTGDTERIFRIAPGASGIFDGVAPDGDDVVTSFDSLAMGIRDPEGIAFNPDNGNLYVLSGRDHLIGEMQTDGTLVRYIDVSAINGVNLSGLEYAPASDDPSSRSLYIVARGVDNAIDPLENDGLLYEVHFPLNIDNLPPFVNAGQDEVIGIGDEAILEGIVADDGNPDPPAALNVIWSQVSGPATAHFGDDSALQTTVTLPNPGVYVLRLTADDGELSASDEVTVTVLPPGLVHLPVVVYDLVADD